MHILITNGDHPVEKDFSVQLLLMSGQNTSVYILSTEYHIVL